MPSYHIKEDTKWVIYYLYDPSIGEPRYVGFTSLPLKKRLNGHVGDSKRKGPTPVNNWVKSVLNAGNRPCIKVIEDGIGTEWSTRERYWIKNYREKGYRLLNYTDGGEGLFGIPLTEEAKRKIGLANASKIRTEEHCRNISIGLNSRTEEEKKATSLKQSIAHTGLKRGPETLAKISSIHKGKKVKVETTILATNNTKSFHLKQRALNDAQVSQIIQLLAAGLSCLAISKKFDVSEIIINRVKRGVYFPDGCSVWVDRTIENKELIGHQKSTLGTRINYGRGSLLNNQQVEYIKNSDKTQIDLAIELGVSKTSIGRAKSGKYKTKQGVKWQNQLINVIY